MIAGGPAIEHVYQLSRQLLGQCAVYIAAPREEPYWERYVRLVGETRVCEIPHRRFSLGALRRLTEWCRTQNIEILHSHGRAAGLYGRLGRLSLSPRHPRPAGPMPLRSWRAPSTGSATSCCPEDLGGSSAVSPTKASSMRRQLLRRRGIATIINGVQLPSSGSTPASSSVARCGSST